MNMRAIIATRLTVASYYMVTIRGLDTVNLLIQEDNLG